MRILPFLLLAILALPLPAHAVAVPGEDAPDFTATDTNGIPVRLADLKGNYVVLEWTNRRCPFVRKHYDSGNMQALQKKYTAKGVIWLSIISSAEGKEGFVTDAEANKTAKDWNAGPSHIIRDPLGSIGHLYGAKTTPHMFVVDKAGKVAYAGAIDSVPSTEVEDLAKAENYIDKTFAALEANKKVETASTRAYGCSVKY